MEFEEIGCEVRVWIYLCLGHAPVADSCGNSNKLKEFQKRQVILPNGQLLAYTET